MGNVWLVEDEKTRERMALKCMRAEIASTEKGRNLFQREAFNGCQLNHPNIVRHYKRGYSNHTYFLLMEYCNGGSVEDLIKRNRKIFWEDGALKERIEISTHIILQTLDGLHYLHNVPITVNLADDSTTTANGVVHRDLKPGNILLSDDSLRPVAKVADFGLAKAFQTAGKTKFTRHGEVGGHLMFMPRQQIYEYRYAKPDMDTWSAAACYYYMLTGLPPKDFISGSIADVALVADAFTIQSSNEAFSRRFEVKIALNTNTVPIRKRDHRIPERLAEVIDTALIEVPEIGKKTDKKGNTIIKINSALKLKEEIKAALGM
jgi:serine/threonine-protein kinase